MGSMAQIEMLVLLQSVDLFSYCTAEQVLRLSMISRDVSFVSGDTVYERNDVAEALYCVLSGQVELERADGSIELAGPGKTFGVHDILRDRLRPHTATARADTHVLAIEAEDFFDLLSNNIEIVKALFRRLSEGDT